MKNIDKRFAHLLPIILFLSFLISFAAAAVSPLTVHFIDVGQADSILIQSPNGHHLLIDAGNNADGPSLVAYLNKLHIQRLDAVVGTHPHEDHIGSLDTIINTFEIGRVFLPKVSTNTKTFKDVLLAVKNKGLKVSTAKAGIELNLDPALKVTMLGPNSEHYQDLNNYSAVIKITYHRVSFLFTGDAEAESEAEMLQKGFNLKADVLKVGHHGSNSSTSEPFLKAVAPKYAVISVGTGNSYGHPHPTTLQRLQTVCRVFRTDRDGTVIMTSDGQTVTIK